MGGRESTDTVKNVLCGSQDLPNSLSQQMRRPGHRTPFNHSHPTWRQFPLQNICFRPDSFLFERHLFGRLQIKSLQETCPGNHCAVATDSNQPRRCSGVPHHVTSGASQRLFVPRVTWYPTGSNKTQAKPLAICRILQPLVAYYNWRIAWGGYLAISHGCSI